MQPATRLARSVRLLFVSLLMLANHAIAGSQVGLAITGGDNQSVATSNAFPAPLSVRLADSSGDPIENETINFSVQSSGGAGADLASFSVETDASGNAQITAIANDVPGTYIVRASVGDGGTRGNVTLGDVQSVDFNLTNLRGAPAAATAVPASSTTTIILLAFLVGFAAWRAAKTPRQHG